MKIKTPALLNRAGDLGGCGVERWYHIYFKDKLEYVDGPETTMELPIGSLLFSFLDVDWDALTAELSNFHRQHPSTEAAAECFAALRKRFAGAHRFISHMIERLTLEPDPDALYLRVSELARFKQTLTEQIKLTLDSEGTYINLTPMQRYALLQRTSPTACVFAQSMYDLVFVQHRISENGQRVFAISRHEITPELVSKVKGSKLSAHLFYCADDIRALVYLEYEYMGTQGYAIRRCDNCGRWFLPYSVVALYCDRIVEGRGKSCKEIAAAEKYNRKVNSDAAKKHYTRLNNNYQMRCARSPELYPAGERKQWQRMAKALMQEVSSGTLSYEDFTEAIKLPNAKQHTKHRRVSDDL